MTNHRPDIHCDGCGIYSHSLSHRPWEQKFPEHLFYCEDCKPEVDKGIKTGEMVNFEWYKKGNSSITTKNDIQDCKHKTFLWWPFVTYQRCMKKRGYILILKDKKRKVTEQKPANNQSDFQKLMELKQLKDKGIISTEEYEQKKKKYLLKY